jgi:hypothetical protein
MKNIFLLSLALLLFSCGTDTPPPAQEQAKPSKYEKTLAKYQDISFDTLKVFSTFEDPDTGSYFYRGQMLDSTELEFIPGDYVNPYNKQMFYACYKFPFDSTRIALITRCPGEYSATALRLFLFDTKADSITADYFLADAFGDAGEVVVTTAWLTRPENGILNYLNYYQSEYSHSMENENDTTVDRCTRASMLSVRNGISDTTEISDLALIKRFLAIETKK